MRHAFIDEVEIDQDVCLGDYDSHITVKTHEVVLFEGNTEVDRRLIRDYSDAIAVAEGFVDSGLQPIEL
jgi:hypothetical protein